MCCPTVFSPPTALQSRKRSWIWTYDDDWEIRRIEQGYSARECKEFMQPHHYVELPEEFDLETYQIHHSQVKRRLEHQESIDLGNRE